MRKLFVLGIILILLFIAGAAYFYFWPKNNVPAISTMEARANPPVDRDAFGQSDLGIVKIEDAGNYQMNVVAHFNTKCNEYVPINMPEEQGKKIIIHYQTKLKPKCEDEMCQKCEDEACENCTEGTEILLRFSFNAPDYSQYEFELKKD